MLTLHVIGSSSKGNGYLLEAEHTALLIEAGVPLLEVKKAIGFNISKIAGCLISHAHGDHAKYAQNFMKAGIQCHASTACADAIGHHRSLIQFADRERFNVGDFEVMTYPVVHDVPCHCFLIRYKDNTFCFVTDTHYVPYTFDGLTNVIVECNYQDEILQERVDRGSVAPMVRDRVLNSHLSFDTCRDFLRASDLSKVNNIVLIHLSDSNSDAREFRAKMQQETGKAVHIAQPGMRIDFNAKPF